MIDKLEVNPTFSDSYSITIDSCLDFSHLFSYISDKQVLVVTNTILRKLYLSKLLGSISSISKVKTCILDDGEKHKSQQSLDKILTTLLENKFTRTFSTLVALGGGVIGDVTGFAAAIYQRGIDFIQIPTTLLSQVDSSVGGKTAINHTLGKNMIGAFYQPKFVYISLDFYKTLPQREYLAGMAEVVKYGFISKDFFTWLELNRQKILLKDKAILTNMVKKSCQIKAQIVAKDEKEVIGVRALLNFGHTFAHALEKCQDYHGLNHGEAVAVGMAQAIDFSNYLGLVTKSLARSLKEFIISFGLSIDFPKNIKKSQYLDTILVDKKNTDKQLRFVLVKNIGDLQLQKRSRKELEDFLEITFSDC